MVGCLAMWIAISESYDINDLRCYTTVSNLLAVEQGAQFGFLTGSQGSVIETI